MAKPKHNIKYRPLEDEKHEDEETLDADIENLLDSPLDEEH